MTRPSNNGSMSIGWRNTADDCLADLNVVLDALLGREPWRAEADAIVTRSLRDFAGSPVPILILIPAELLALLAKANDP
jgi:hypothetical protein